MYWLKRLLKKINEPVVVQQGMYAFTKIRRGEFIILLNESPDGVMEFMQIPDRYRICLTKQEFVDGIKNNVLDFVEKIPDDVFEVCKANIENFEKIP